MASNTFIKFDGIAGEATHRNHRDAIDVIAWAWGLTVARPEGSTRRRGVAQPQALSFVHRYDKASPRLARAAVTGIHIRSAVLSTHQGGTAHKDYLVFTLSDVTVTSIQLHDDGEGPMEEVALSYGQLSMSYAPQTADGSQVAPVEFSWDTRAA